MTDAAIGIVGAGPAGLAAAYCLAREGVPVDVFEAGDTVGGMSRTFELWGQRVDLGPHRFFSADARVNRLWLEVAAGEYRMVQRQTRIFYGGKFFHYPLRVGDALAGLGPLEAVLSVGSYLREFWRRRPAGASPDESFEHWVRGRFGQRLYDRFFRVYSEKLWGIPCSRLDADFAAQRIRKLSFFEAVVNALRQGRNNTHATLVDRFAYPLGGTGSIYRKMADAVTAAGGVVHLRTPVRAVLPDAGAGPGLELVDGRRLRYRHVISTMPLTRMVAALPDVPAPVARAAAQLRFRNTIVVYLRLEATGLFPDQWIYVHSPELAVGRITNFRNWVPELYGDSAQTILALELWCNPQDELWRDTDEQLIALATADLRRTGLAGDAAISAGHVVKVPFCYPVYDLGYREHVGVVRDYLRTLPGLSVIGRYGSFKYNNQDHSLLMGLLVAENIAHGAAHDLWRVNVDDEYQEAAIISETGLVPQAS